MTIAETREICKGLLARVPRDALVVVILVLASLLSFGLGYLTGTDASSQRSGSALGAPSPAASTTSGQLVVASKNGTKYYFPWCAGAERISEAHKVWFTSAAYARAAGYAPSANCAGL